MAYDPEYKDIILLVFGTVLVGLTVVCLVMRIGFEVIFRYTKNIPVKRFAFIAQYISSILGVFLFGNAIVYYLAPISWGGWYVALWFHAAFWIVGFLVINRHADWPKEKPTNADKVIPMETIAPPVPEIEAPVVNEPVPTKLSKRAQLLQIGRQFFVNIWKGFMEKKIFTIVMLLVIVAITVFYSLAITDCCFTFYPIFISTAMSRIVFKQGQLCTWNQVCYSYLTVPEDISTSMIVNYQFQGPAPDQAYALVSEANMPPVPFYATCFQHKLKEEQRHQCWADLTNLAPNTTYYYTPVIIVQGSNVTGTTQKFRTGPSGDGDYSFVNGGDVMASASGIALLKHSATLEPLFFIVGGDIAYENGDPNCYRRWDQFFVDWNKYTTTPTGYSVPLLTCIGNHEASGFNVPREYDSYYIRIFPHFIGSKMTDPQSRDLYHAHTVGSQTAILLMDSSVHTSVSAQTKWVNNTLSMYSNRKRIYTVYHVPMYPSKSDSSIGVQQKNQWAPLFDRYNVTVGFEHHLHLYKRTHKIYNNQVSTDRGTYYFGDGCLGIEDAYPAQYFSKSPLVADIQNIPNIWQVSTNSTTSVARAYGYSGSIVTLTPTDIVL